MWTWGMLCSPKMVGTVQGKPRVETAKADEGQREAHENCAWNPYTIAQWNTLRLQQTILFWQSVALQFIVALVGSIFMISFKELCVSLYMRDSMPPLVQSGIKFILMPAPALVALGIGGYAAWEWSTVTINQEPGESFRGQVSNAAECCGKCLPRGLIDGPSRERTKADRTAGWVMFVLGELILLAWTVATFQGLCPDLKFLMGEHDLTIPKVAQAELWASSGFLFFFVHIPRVVSIVFSTWEDLESLKYLENPDMKNDAKDNHSDGSTYSAVGQNAS